MRTATLLLICASLATAAPAPLIKHPFRIGGTPRIVPMDVQPPGPDQRPSDAAPQAPASAQPEDWDKHHGKHSDHHQPYGWDQSSSDAAPSATASAQKPEDWDKQHGKHRGKQFKHWGGHGHAKGWSKREEPASDDGGMSNSEQSLEGRRILASGEPFPKHNPADRRPPPTLKFPSHNSGHNSGDWRDHIMIASAKRAETANGDMDMNDSEHSPERRLFIPKIDSNWKGSSSDPKGHDHKGHHHTGSRDKGDHHMGNHGLFDPVGSHGRIGGIPHAETANHKGDHHTGSHDKGNHHKGDYDKGDHHEGDNDKGGNHKDDDQLVPVPGLVLGASGNAKRGETASGKEALKVASGGFNGTEHKPHNDNSLKGEHHKGEHHKGEHHKGEHHKGEHHKGEHHKHDHHRHGDHKGDHHKPGHHKSGHQLEPLKSHTAEVHKSHTAEVHGSHTAEVHGSHTAEAHKSHTVEAHKTHAAESHKSFSVGPQHTSQPTAPVAKQSGAAHVSAGGDKTELDEKFKKLRELLQYKAKGKDGLRRTDTGNKNNEREKRSGILDHSAAKAAYDHDRAMLEYQFGAHGGVKALEKLMASRGLPDVDYNAIKAELGRELVPPGIHRGGVEKRNFLDFLKNIFVPQQLTYTTMGFRQRSEEPSDDGEREAFEQLLRSRGQIPEEVKDEFMKNFYNRPTCKHTKTLFGDIYNAFKAKAGDPIQVDENC